MFVTAAGVSVFDATFMINNVNRDRTLLRRRLNHDQVLQHIQSKPERYRVLVPYTLEIFVRALSVVMPRDKAFDRAFAAYALVAAVMVMWAEFAYLRRWFSDQEALIACLVIASTLPLSLQQPYAVWSLVEAAFAPLVLLLALDDRRVLLGVVIALASLNRETAIFLVVLYALTEKLTKRHVATVLVYLGIWLTLVGGLRLIISDAPRRLTQWEVWHYDLLPINVAISATNAFLFFGLFWLFAILGFGRAPAFMRRTALLVPIYLAFFYGSAFWWEVRPFMTLYPVVLPLALSYLFVPRETPVAGGYPELASLKT